MAKKAILQNTKTVESDEEDAGRRAGDHGSTDAGQPLALAAARATIAELEAIDAPAAAIRIEAALRAGLEPLPGVDHVRGRGLLLGVELNEAGLAGRSGAEIARACLDRGLILNGVTPTALRLAPPFILTSDQITEAIDVMAAVIAEGAS